MISGARRPRARCAVSDRRLAEATAACKAPSAAHRTAVGGGGLSHRRWRARCEGSHAWTRPLALHPLLQESDGPRPRVGVGSPKHLRVGKAKRARVGKNRHPRRDAKSADADRLVTLHAKFISSHG